MNLILGPFNDASVPSSIYHLLPLIQDTIAKTKELYFLELNPEHFHPELFGPRIYRYSTWLDSHEKWIKRKEKSEKERQERFILEANIKLISKRLKRLIEMNELYSIGTAQAIMRLPIDIRDIKLKAFEITLINRVEDIP